MTRDKHATAVVTAVTEDIRHALEESKVTSLVLFHYAKAFDSIPHQRLLQKLNIFYLTNPSKTWFYTYICERYQAVENEDGTITSWAKSSSVVTQGSILGPFLFALFRNDLTSVLQSVSYMLYTDDIQDYGNFKLAEMNQGLTNMQNNAYNV